MRIALIIAVVAGICHAQPAPQFEVASVKLAGAPPVFASTIGESRVNLSPVNLKYLIQLAYKVEAFQVSGPDWITKTGFSLMAKPPEGATKEQIPVMLQALLADRFGLVLHREAREQQIYALLPGKDGPKLNDAALDNQPDTQYMTGRTMLQKISTEGGDGFWTISSERSNPDGVRTFDAPRITMAEFARTLTPYLELPVVNMTGIKVPYHVRLDVPLTLAGARNRASLPVEPPADHQDVVSIFSSVQKLGLTLEKRKAPIESLIVDHAERVPTEN